MASVAVGINCMGPLGGNQGLWPYPSGPSQLSTPLSLGHIHNLTLFNIIFTNNFVYYLHYLRQYCPSVNCAVLGKINVLSFFLSFTYSHQDGIQL